MRAKGSLILLALFLAALVAVPAWHVTHGAHESCGHGCSAGCAPETGSSQERGHNAAECQICRVAALPMIVFAAPVLPAGEVLPVGDSFLPVVHASFARVPLLDGPPRAPPSTNA